MAPNGTLVKNFVEIKNSRLGICETMWIGARKMDLNVLFIFQFYKMLQQHIQAKHTLEKPFKCEVCAYSHATKAGLKQHVVNSHPKDEVMLYF